MNEFQATGRTDAGQDLEEFDAPNVNPQDQAEYTAQRVAAAFEATKLIEIVEVKASLGQVHLMGRVHKDNEKDFTHQVVTPILRTAEKSSIDVHLCKQFFLKQDTLRYAWVISFASDDIKTAAFKITESVAQAVPHREIMEAPLSGPSAPQSGGRTSGRRGASPLGG